MAAPTLNTLLLPGAIIGSEGVMRLSVNAFVDPSVYSDFAVLEAFGWLTALGCSAGSLPAPLLVRVLPLPALGSLCRLQGSLDPLATVALDQDGCYPDPAWLLVTSVTCLPVPRYAVPAWRTVAFQAAESVDPITLPHASTRTC